MTTNPAARYAPTNEYQTDCRVSHLDGLEAEAIFVLREVAAECQNPALLYSGGKDSAVVLHLAAKAFFPGRITLPLLHVDTGHNFPEVIDYRDRMAGKYSARLEVRTLDDSIARGTVVLRHPLESRNPHQSVTLVEAIAELKIDACIGGARRDEEKARAKERIFSFRDALGQWDPRNQRPELWGVFNTRVRAGEHMRVFPISNWTELDVWQYILRENIELPDIYFAHRREVVRRGNLLMPVTPITPPRSGETVEDVLCRFRTVGDITCTAPVESDAATVADIILETAMSRITERGATRLDDQASSTAMEQRKKLDISNGALMRHRIRFLNRLQKRPPDLFGPMPGTVRAPLGLMGRVFEHRDRETQPRFAQAREPRAL